MPAARYADLLESAVNPRRPVGPSTASERLANLHDERFVAHLPARKRSSRPGVEAASRDAEDAAHASDAELVFVLLDEVKLHFWSSAKYASAFFRMSRSSVTSRNCWRSARMSSESVPVLALPEPGSVPRPSNSFQR